MYFIFYVPFCKAIATAAMEMLGGEEAIKASRKPEIMADAAYYILTNNDKGCTGQFLIDDIVLKQHGISNLDQYANVPGINSFKRYICAILVFFC